MMKFMVTFMQQRNPANLNGIDISHYETGIAINDIAAQGKQIVYMKASEGSNIIDASFPQFNPAVRALGIKTGAYHFAHFYKVSTIADQVKNFLNQIRGQALDCTLVFDCELSGWHDKLDSAAVTAQALDMAQKLNQATGVKVVFYSNTAFIQEHLTTDIKQLDAWIADIRNPNAPGENGLIETWLGFQYSWSGKVGGKAVDLNEFTTGMILPQSFVYGAPVPVPTPAPTPPSGDPAIKAYQHNLNVIKIHDDSGQAIAEDGINGPKTMQAVVRLEKLMNLTVDSGIWGKQCENAYASLTGIKPVLSQRSTGSFVNYLQYRLGGLKIDGIFGSLTLTAVKTYQTSHALNVDGIVGTLTWASLMK
jgi:GH25 family lysozyme M1 (1,4-beta-N-acetylmuramidase)